MNKKQIDIAIAACRKTMQELKAMLADEPEIIERKITIDGCLASRGKLVYTDEKVLEQRICEASIDPDFIGFKFTDGSWHDKPIKAVNAAGEIVFGPIFVADIISGAVRILNACHVLFRRKK